MLLRASGTWKPDRPEPKRLELVRRYQHHVEGPAVLHEPQVGASRFSNDPQQALAVGVVGPWWKPAFARALPHDGASVGVPTSGRIGMIYGTETVITTS